MLLLDLNAYTDTVYSQGVFELMAYISLHEYDLCSLTAG